MRAHIHHIDNNTLNNPLDGSNWIVICAKCHRQVHKKNNNCNRSKVTDGIYISVVFSPKKRAEILSKVNYRCQKCGVSVNTVNSNKTYRCEWCDRRCGKKECIQWDDGRTMCNECFNEWDSLGRPKRWWPSQKKLSFKKNGEKRKSTKVL